MANGRKKKGLLAGKRPAPLYIAPAPARESLEIDPLAGRIFELELETAAPGGELFARCGSTSFYVDVGCPGQKIRAEVISSSKDSAQARRLAVITPAPGQADAFCAHFGVCGGCQWQEIPYPVQLELKQTFLRKVLLNSGGFSAAQLDKALQPIVASPEVRNFRAKMEFAFSAETPGDKRNSRQPVTLLGLRKRGSHQVVPIENCPVAAPEFQGILQVAREWVQRSGLSAYKPGEAETGNRILRFLNLRISKFSGKIAVELITFPAPHCAGKIMKLGQALLERPAVACFTHMTRETEDYLSAGEHTVFQLGDECLREELGGFQYDLLPGAFFQTNIEVAALLQQTVLEIVSRQVPDMRTEAWDLYSGVGALSLPLAPLFEKVVGFELSRVAVVAAQRNARLNGFSNCVFAAGDAPKLVRKFPGTPQLVVLDPPRAGLAAELVKTLLLKKVGRLVYVSCNPDTLARDLRSLSEKYELESVQGLDMFPHTHHLETIALLKRRE